MGRLFHKRALLVGIASLATGVSICVTLTVATPAEACPIGTEQIRKAEPYAGLLPDCRAYEQVSPVDKNTTDVMGRPGYVQSSPLGESVTYYSVAPLPGIAASSEFPQYLSTRTGAGWSMQGLNLPAEAGAESLLYGLTEDNDETIAGVSGEFEERFLLAPGAVLEHTNAYVRNNATGEYKLLGTHVGAVTYADSTPDGTRILFTSTGHELVHGIVDETEKPYLYEWDREGGKLSFVGYVKGEAPELGTVAGSKENEAERTYDQDTLSEDGSRIFFSEKEGEGKVYMREPEAERTVEISQGAAQWRAATPDGSRAFYTENGNLWEYDVGTDTRAAITSGSAGVLGVLGISKDGSYAYFAAEGVLAANENGNKQKAEFGTEDANLYEWHDGAVAPITFIATLDNFYDNTDWEGFVQDAPGTSDQGYKASRVSTDEAKLLFSSRDQVTDYNNANRLESYLYDPLESLSPTNPRCVSCNPTGEAASQPAYLSNNNLDSAPVPSNSFMTRNLSANGTRVFFQTAEALLPAQATDGQENVYEWEQEGTGGCGTGEGDENGGCLYMISSGQSTGPSYFGDASENGEDVFFFTRQSLVSQDQDRNVDLYDAREDGGIAAQNPALPEAPCESETCRGGAGSGLVFGPPASTTLSGTGNLTPPVESNMPVKPRHKPLTRAQKLANALKACKRKPSGRRARCRAEARRNMATQSRKPTGGGSNG